MTRITYEGVKASLIYEAAKQAERGSTITYNKVKSVLKHIPCVPKLSLNDFQVNQLKDVPETARDIFNSDEWMFWLLAMNEEVEIMSELDVYEEVTKPDKELLVGCRWVFTRKIDKETNKVKRYRARLVAQGFSQIDQVHFDNTWSPVARWDTLRLMFGVGALRGYQFKSCDISKAYLNAKLDHAIHMAKPKGFRNNNHVWLLQRAVYGLKQAGACWYKMISKFIVDAIGGTPNEMDPCLFRVDSETQDDKHQHAFIILYVDDIFIMGTNKTIINTIQSRLNGRFKMSEESDTDVGMLGVRLANSNDGTKIIDHSYHIKSFLLSNNTEPTKYPLSSPGISKSRLTINDGEIYKHEEYMKLVGQLQYISNTTRPDITYSVNSLSRFTHNPGQKHWAAAMRVVKHIANTPYQSITFEKGTQSKVLKLIAYSDADWSGDQDCYSIGGSVITLNGSPVMWSSKKQKLIAMSSAESEFIAASTTYRLLNWAKQLLECAGLTAAKPELRMDSEVAINAIKTNCTTKQMRFINLRFRYVCHGFNNGDFDLTWVKGSNNPADIFTKPLDPTTHNHLCGLLQLTQGT
jgi:hypothetical protein